MKKVLSGLVLASAFVLTACGGGSSDSSGSHTISTPLQAQKASYELKFAKFPTCETQKLPDGRLIIYAARNDKNLQHTTPAECKLTLPNVNKGLVFSLKCDAYVDRNTKPTFIISAIEDQLSAVQTDLTKIDKYVLTCVKDKL